MKRQLSSIAAESDAQMQMYDELGPLTRAALDNCLRAPNIRALMRAFKQEWVNSWLEKNFDSDAPPPQKSFAELDQEFAAFVVDKMRVLCPIQGRPLTCLVPRKVKPLRASRRLIRSLK